MKTTFGKIYSFDPCSSGWNTLCTNKLGTLQLTAEQLEKEISILEILESNGIKHAVWALRTQQYRDYCLFLADVAESVLHLFEKECPGDMRVRNLIAGMRRWHAGEISDEELDVLRIAVAAAAVAAAAEANAAANAAAKAAHYAAKTAAVAAAAEADAAANAATNAAAVAAASATNTAGYAATNAAAASASREQWQKIEELLRKHLRKGDER